MTSLEVFIPIKTISEANVKEHWAVKAKRAKSQREMVWVVLTNLRHQQKLKKIKSATITLTRIGPRRLDGDNLQRSFKAVRDQVAECIGIDDGSPLLTWVYSQERGKPREYGVCVKIERAA